MSNESTPQSPLRLFYFHNELPPDDLQFLLRQLYNQSKDNGHPYLARFLNEAVKAVRKEVSKLPLNLRSLVGPFESIHALAEQESLRRGVLCGSIDGVILFVLQLGIFIGNCETHSPNQVKYRELDSTILLGLGIGLLVATTLSLSPTLGDVPSVGAEVVCIIFRLGVLVADTSQNLEPLDEDGKFDSWAHFMRDVRPKDVQRELDELHSYQARTNISEMQCPEATKVFISAKSKSSVTLSGPPSRLNELKRVSEFFQNRKAVPLPVFGGLCHAGHVYTDKDAIQVVASPVLGNCHPWVPVLATGNGIPFPAENGAELLQQVILEILARQIVWEEVIKSVVEYSRASKSYRPVAICAIRGSLPLNELKDALDARETAPATQISDLAVWIDHPTSGGSNPGLAQQSKIAIVGMSCRMAGGATNTERFWDVLEKGLDVHRRIPEDRFDAESHYDPEGKWVNASHTPYGCFIEEPGLFDAPFFNMSPREAEQTDPMQRLALVTAYEALERAGFVADRTPSSNKTRVGTWFGQASDDYREVNTAQEISTYFIPGGCRAFGPGRINYFFKFSGPSYSCDTACSSSLAAIQNACTALWNAEVDTVVAGGMNILSNSDAFAGLSQGHFLTKTPNACKTWDVDADGYCRGDGVASIVMKRLEDAEADNDNILGIIVGAGTNHSADAVSITHPHAGSQAFLYRKVLDRAGVDPFDVSYIEAHGTGTQAGDIQELTSITDVFAPLTARRRSSNQPLAIGAVKSNFGHSEAAAGVTSLLKVLLMFQKHVIPPHVGIKTSLNPKLPRHLDKRNLHIPFKATPWPRNSDKKRIAMVNSFSAAGGNTSLVVEEAPDRPLPQADPRPSHAVAVSAKSKVSLKGNLERLLTYLDENPSVSLANLSYTTTARRHHYNHRLTFNVSDVSMLREQIAHSLKSIERHRPVPNTLPPSVAFTFTGQGGAYKSSNLELFHHSPLFRLHIFQLDRIVQGLGFPSFIPSINGSSHREYDHGTIITQVALTCVEIALAKYWESLGVKPDLVMGHSLGEYAALCVAGVLSASDAIYLVGTRARLLEQRCSKGTHGMLAVRSSVADIKGTIGHLSYEIACINSPDATVLTAEVIDLEVVESALKEAGYACTRLEVAFAFHSTQTDPILEDYERLAKSNVTFRTPKIPVISPLLARVVCDGKTVNARYLARATRETCNYLSAISDALSVSIIDKETVWIEIGPHPVTAAFVKTVVDPSSCAVPSLRRGENNWTTLAQSLGALHCVGVGVNWNEFHRPFEEHLRLLDLPTYCWTNKNHWIQYNGNWALTKGNCFYDSKKNTRASAASVSSFQTSLVHRIIAEEFSGMFGTVTMESDLMSSDFLTAARGHSMNGCAVVTSSIHADIAYTLGEYVTKNLGTPLKSQDLNIASLKVSHGLVARADTSKPQLIRVIARTTSLSDGISVEWYNVDDDGSTSPNAFATAALACGTSSDFLASWVPLTHLIESRIDALDCMSRQGIASQFSGKMAYTLFASSLVDYADKYRGMQSVVISSFEGFAKIRLSTEQEGVWTVPPHFIDSVAHLAGFIMNVSDAHDTVNNFCVTPGWNSMRLAKPLEPGSELQSYVKMIPSKDDDSVFFGDIYVLQNGEIVGMVGGIQFRRYPRILLSRFFSPSDSYRQAQLSLKHRASIGTYPIPVQLGVAGTTPRTADQEQSNEEYCETPPTSGHPDMAIFSSTTGQPTPSESPGSSKRIIQGSEPESMTTKATGLIATETGIAPSELIDDARFSDIGIDSLMSLVIAEKFRTELGIAVNSGLFLEYPTMGALRSWLLEYYS
ncbi:unnamed protein product [Clonostachys byssicola]|uniref:Polyketide synthase n=1 Tax=Clonostachys byssicola TaxID=160290 RepID=A0A9N9XYL6_9HYPO|nr:unnamed protein product [Clonostachys byssicola]